MNPWQRLGLLVVGMVVGTGSVQAQTTLRYKFKDDDKFGYVLDQKMTMSTNVMGKDIEIKINQSMDMSWQILKVRAGGSADVKISFTGVKMAMDGPMGKIEVDSKNPKPLDDQMGRVLGQVVNTIAEMEMTFTMDSLGEIKDIKGAVRVPKGQTMDEMTLYNWDWPIEGVSGLKMT